MSFIALSRKDLVVGMPLPWAVHDRDGNVLLPEGATVATEEQALNLLAGNAFRELRLEQEASPSRSTDAAVPPPNAEAGESGASFKDMRLKIGDRIQLQLPPSVSTERHIVKLIGYVDNASLLVTTPLANGLRVPLRESDTIIARAFSCQRAFGFSSVVQRVCKSPYDYLHLSFPDQVQGAVVRKSPRVRTHIIASVSSSGTRAGDERQSAIIVNLSADGALLKGYKPLLEGGPIDVSFRVNLHNIDTHLTLTAEVRSMSGNDEKNEDRMFSHGVRFVDMPSNDSIILQSLIYQQMIEQPDCLT